MKRRYIMNRTKRLGTAAAFLAVLVLVHGAIAANPVTTLDQRLTETATTVNTLAATSGDQAVADMLSTALDVDANALLLQHQELGGTWGDLLVAHELSQISRSGVTTERVFALRSESMSWSQILANLRISPAKLSGELGTDLATMGIAPTTTRTTSTGIRTGRTFGGATQDGTTSGGTTVGGTTNSGTTTGGTTTNGTTSGGTPADGTTTDGTTTDGTTTDGTNVGTTSGGTTTSGTSSRLATSGLSGKAAGIERSLTDNVSRLDAEATSRGDAAVADRLASELGVSASLLEEQRATFDADWGDLLVAYTITQQSRGSFTVGDVLDLRNDGMTWFQIAKAMKVAPGRLMNTIRNATGRVLGTSVARTDRKVWNTLKDSRSTKRDRALAESRPMRTRSAKLTTTTGRAVPHGARTLGVASAATKMTRTTMTARATARTAAMTAAQAMRVQRTTAAGRGRR
jgi:hypothetical protein